MPPGGMLCEMRACRLASPAVAPVKVSNMQPISCTNPTASRLRLPTEKGQTRRCIQRGTFPGVRALKQKEENTSCYVYFLFFFSTWKESKSQGSTAVRGLEASQSLRSINPRLKKEKVFHTNPFFDTSCLPVCPLRSLFVFNVI